MKRLIEEKSLKYYLFTFLFITVQIIGCGSTNSESESFETETSNPEWLLTKEEILDGGPGRDGIPSIDDPKFKTAKNIDYVDDNRMIIGIRVGDVIKAYPHQVMDYHEIVNDLSDNVPYSMTYCPLTGTALAWERSINGEPVEFGVSGLLYRNNLISYDRQTNSYFSQMQVRGIHGSQIGKPLKSLMVVQTTWSTWKRVYPESMVLTTETGFNRNYDEYAYGANYTDLNSGTLFPVKNKDDRLPNKKRVYGVIQVETADQDSRVMVYPIDDFGSGVNLINGRAENKPIIIAGSSEHHFAVTFLKELKDGTELKFEPIQDSLPVIMKDQEGNRWDLFGYAIEGPRKGHRLENPLAYSGYWFAWVDFFPLVDIYGDDSIPNP